MRRQLLVIPLVALGMITAAGSAAAHETTVGERAADAARPAATVVRAISPLDADGHLATGYRVRHEYSDANCESGSPTTGHAYQCFTPQSAAGIYDSCWVQSNRHYVICLVKPWQRKTDRLHVTRGYGDSTGFLKVHQPWGVRLGPKIRCLRILGPVHTANGQPITYGCNHRTVLAGRISRSGATWRAHAYRRIHHAGRPPGYRSLGVQPVAIAWFGKRSQKD